VLSTVDDRGRDGANRDYNLLLLLMTTILLLLMGFIGIWAKWPTICTVHSQQNCSS
jgi:hypothetical protein